ncbi:MAG: hypothetical protein QM768_07560 [Agriterribacter sp.]
MQQKELTEQESLKLITEMIGKTNSHYHESGASTILWGTVISFCALVSFAQSFCDFSIGFDIWILTIVAVFPQVWIGIKEGKSRVVKTYQESHIDIVWMVYVISIFAMLVYANVVSYTSAKLVAGDGLEIFSKNISSGEIKPYRIFPPSFSSVMMILYAFPTLATGLITKYKPLIIGALICYTCFVISLFTSFTYDMLLSAIATICCWLIPGLLLRNKYLKQKKDKDV